ncbi:MAG: hypothetical protein JXR40_09005 [Pontiellaceae bacterium]|nr:hypothetical protein [Pontiellaceae bacterium]
MIDFSQLNKEQKQYIFLGVITLAIFVWLGVLGSKEALSSMKSIDEALADENIKIESAEHRLARQPQVNRDYLPTMQQAVKYLIQDIPDKNRLTEMQTIIYSLEKGTGLSVINIKEIQLVQGGNAGRGTLSLNSYALQINAKGSYESVLQFVEAIYKEFPLARVVQVNIKSQAQEPEQHSVEIQIQWLCDFSSFLEKWEGLDALGTDLETEIDAVLIED